MKAACALSVVLMGTSCSSVGHVLHRQPRLDPDNAQVMVDKSNDPFAPGKARLKLPGIDDAGTAAGAESPGAAAPDGAAAKGSMFDFSSAFQNPGLSRAAHWRFSGADAIEEARRKGMPLLILFVHQSSPPAQMMDTALSSSPELTGDAPRFIPLRLDFSEKATNESAYYKALSNRYKVRGYPLLVLTLPDGTELTRQAGCTKDWRSNVNHWLDDAAARARSGIDGHRRHMMEGQKYHLWKNKDGQEIFAKLESQDANKLVFTNEWGETIHTFINRLSEADQHRIEAKQF